MKLAISFLAGCLTAIPIVVVALYLLAQGFVRRLG